MGWTAPRPQNQARPPAPPPDPLKDALQVMRQRQWPGLHSAKTQVATSRPASAAAVYALYPTNCHQPLHPAEAAFRKPQTVSRRDPRPPSVGLLMGAPLGRAAKTVRLALGPACREKPLARERLGNVRPREAWPHPRQCAVYDKPRYSVQAGACC